MDTARAPTSGLDSGRAVTEQRARSDDSASDAGGLSDKSELSDVQGIRFTCREPEKVLSLPSVSESDGVFEAARRMHIVSLNVAASNKNCGIPRVQKDIYDRKSLSEPNFMKQGESEIGSLRDEGEYKFSCAKFITRRKGSTESTDLDMVESFRLTFNAGTSGNPSLTNVNVAESTHATEQPASGPMRSGRRSSQGNPGGSGTSASHFLKAVRRKRTSETITKTVTERRESVKTVTNIRTGIEEKDAHVELTTKAEEHNKREEEVLETYEYKHAIPSSESQPSIAAPFVDTGMPSEYVPPVVFPSDTTLESQSFSTAFAIKTSAGKPAVIEQPPEQPKKTKPVAIRVYDEERTMQDESGEGTPKADEVHSVSATHPLTKPILKPAHPSDEHVPDDKSKKLGFQESVQQFQDPTGAADKENKESESPEEDDDIMDEPPPPRFMNWRRKDSIAVTKLRMLKQQQEGDAGKQEEEEEEPQEEEEDEESGKRPLFRGPTVIDIIHEEEDATDADSQPVSPEAPAKQGSVVMAGIAKESKGKEISPEQREQEKPEEHAPEAPKKIHVEPQKEEEAGAKEETLVTILHAGVEEIPSAIDIRARVLMEVHKAHLTPAVNEPLEKTVEEGLLEAPAITEGTTEKEVKKKSVQEVPVEHLKGALVEASKTSDEGVLKDMTKEIPDTSKRKAVEGFAEEPPRDVSDASIRYQSPRQVPVGGTEERQKAASYKVDEEPSKMGVLVEAPAAMSVTVAEGLEEKGMQERVVVDPLKSPTSEYQLQLQQPPEESPATAHVGLPEMTHGSPESKPSPRHSVQALEYKKRDSYEALPTPPSRPIAKLLETTSAIQHGETEIPQITHEVTEVRAQISQLREYQPKLDAQWPQEIEIAGENVVERKAHDFLQATKEVQPEQPPAVQEEETELPQITHEVAEVRSQLAHLPEYHRKPESEWPREIVFAGENVVERKAHDFLEAVKHVQPEQLPTIHKEGSELPQIKHEVEEARAQLVHLPEYHPEPSLKWPQEIEFAGGNVVERKVQELVEAAKQVQPEESPAILEDETEIPQIPHEVAEIKSQLTHPPGYRPKPESERPDETEFPGENMVEGKAQDILEAVKQEQPMQHLSAQKEERELPQIKQEAEETRGQLVHLPQYHPRPDSEWPQEIEFAGENVVERKAHDFLQAAKEPQTEQPPAIQEGKTELPQITHEVAEVKSQLAHLPQYHPKAESDWPREIAFAGENVVERKAHDFLEAVKHVQPELLPTVQKKTGELPPIKHEVEETRAQLVHLPEYHPKPDLEWAQEIEIAGENVVERKLQELVEAAKQVQPEDLPAIQEEEPELLQIPHEIAEVKSQLTLLPEYHPKPESERPEEIELAGENVVEREARESLGAHTQVPAESPPAIQKQEATLPQITHEPAETKVQQAQMSNYQAVAEGAHELVEVPKLPLSKRTLAIEKKETALPQITHKTEEPGAELADISDYQPGPDAEKAYDSFNALKLEVPVQTKAIEQETGFPQITHAAEEARSQLVNIHEYESRPEPQTQLRIDFGAEYVVQHKAREFLEAPKQEEPEPTPEMMEKEPPRITHDAADAVLQQTHIPEYQPKTPPEEPGEIELGGVNLVDRNAHEFLDSTKQVQPEPTPAIQQDESELQQITHKTAKAEVSEIPEHKRKPESEKPQEFLEAPKHKPPKPSLPAQGEESALPQITHEFASVRPELTRSPEYQQRQELEKSQEFFEAPKQVQPESTPAIENDESEVPQIRHGTAEAEAELAKIREYQPKLEPEKTREPVETPKNELPEPIVPTEEEESALAQIKHEAAVISPEPPPGAECQPKPEPERPQTLPPSPDQELLVTTSAFEKKNGALPQITHEVEEAKSGVAHTPEYQRKPVPEKSHEFLHPHQGEPPKPAAADEKTESAVSDVALESPEKLSEKSPANQEKESERPQITHGVTESRPQLSHLPEYQPKTESERPQKIEFVGEKVVERKVREFLEAPKKEQPEEAAETLKDESLRPQITLDTAEVKTQLTYIPDKAERELGAPPETDLSGEHAVEWETPEFPDEAKHVLDKQSPSSKGFSGTPPAGPHLPPSKLEPTHPILHGVPSLSEPRPQVLEEPPIPEPAPGSFAVEPLLTEQSTGPQDQVPEGKLETPRQEPSKLDREGGYVTDVSHRSESSDLHVGTDISPAPPQSMTEKTAVEVSKDRSVRDVTNVESYITMSETQEVLYYPTQKVTKKHISETKVITEKRSYTEIIVSFNTSDIQLSGLSHEIELKPVSSDNRKEIKKMSERTCSDSGREVKKEVHDKTLCIECSSLSEVKQSENFFRSASQNLLTPQESRDFLPFTDDTGKPLSAKSSLDASAEWAPTEHATISTFSGKYDEANFPAFHHQTIGVVLDIPKQAFSSSSFNVGETTEKSDDTAASNVHSTAILISKDQQLVPVTSDEVPRSLENIVGSVDISNAHDASEMKSVTEDSRLDTK